MESLPQGPTRTPGERKRGGGRREGGIFELYGNNYLSVIDYSLVYLL